MHPLAEAVRGAADPEAAAALSRYVQVRPGGYGEGDVFVGVKLSRIRELSRPYLRAPFDAMTQPWLEGLLTSPVHEDRQAALVVLSVRAERGDDAERAGIYAAYTAHLEHVDNWDLVDLSCGPIVGGHLHHRDRAPLYAWARSTDLWARRIAMVSTQHFLRSGETADLYRIARLLRDDPHDLIRKAVGWSLREAGRRVDRDELRDFLDREAARLPRITLRYAIEHLGPNERAAYRARR